MLLNTQYNNLAHSLRLYLRLNMSLYSDHPPYISLGAEQAEHGEHADVTLARLKVLKQTLSSVYHCGTFNYLLKQTLHPTLGMLRPHFCPCQSYEILISSTTSPDAI